MSRAAARDVEIAFESTSVDIDTLLEQLAEIVDDTRSSASAHTSLCESEDIELICYEELVQNGGRPCEKALPWLKDSDFKDQDDRMSTALSRQADRWWEFRKWQIDNRGSAVEDDGFCAYLAAQKRRHSILGSHAMISNSSYEATIRRMWTMKPQFVEISSGAGFSEYEKAIKERLTSHNFTQAFRLEVNPKRQGIRDTWIEYLSFEYWETDRLASSLKRSELRYRNACNDLQRFHMLEYSRRMATFCSKINSTNTSSLEQRLSATQAELENLWQKIHHFCQDIASHRLKDDALRRQNIRTQRIREQLYEIETEIETAQKGKDITNDQAQTISSKKRKRTEDENSKSDDHNSKRSRHGDVSKEGAAQPSFQKNSESLGKVTTSNDLTKTRPKRMIRQFRPPCVSNSVIARSPRSSQITQARVEQSTSLV